MNRPPRARPRCRHQCRLRRSRSGSAPLEAEPATFRSSMLFETCAGCAEFLSRPALDRRSCRVTDDKYYPHIGIIRPITAVWMIFELGNRLANACRYVPRTARRSLSQVFDYSLGRRRQRAYSVSSSVVALVGFGNDLVRHEFPAIGVSQPFPNRHSLIV